MDSYHSSTTRPLLRGTQIVWYLLWILEVFLAFRFILKFAGAGTQAGFTHFMYGATAFLVAPFSAVFPRVVINENVVEWATLLAMIVYWIVALAIVQLFFISKSVSTSEAAAKLEK